MPRLLLLLFTLNLTGIYSQSSSIGYEKLISLNSSEVNCTHPPVDYRFITSDANNQIGVVAYGGSIKQDRGIDFLFEQTRDPGFFYLNKVVNHDHSPGTLVVWIDPQIIHNVLKATASLTDSTTFIQPYTKQPPDDLGMNSK